MYKVKNLSRQYKICVKEGYTGVIDFEIRPKFWFVMDVRKKFREYLKDLYKLEPSTAKEFDECYGEKFKFSDRLFLENMFMDQTLRSVK